MDGGPWLFRKDHVVIVEYDGFTNVSDYAYDKIQVWARIKGLSDGLTGKKDLTKKVATKVGEPPITVVVNEGKINLTGKRGRNTMFIMKNFQIFASSAGVWAMWWKNAVMVFMIPTPCDWGDWLLWDLEPSGGGTKGGRGRGFADGGRGGGEYGGGWR